MMVKIKQMIRNTYSPCIYNPFQIHQLLLDLYSCIDAIVVNPDTTSDDSGNLAKFYF